MELTHLKNVPIRMYFFAPKTAQNARDSSFMWTGKIVDIDDFVIKFEHIPTETKRLQCKFSYMNLDVCSLLAIDELADDYDRDTSFECPHCGEKVALEDTLDQVAESAIDQEEMGYTKEEPDTRSDSKLHVV
jgi:hypothetical protein